MEKTEEFTNEDAVCAIIMFICGLISLIYIPYIMKFCWNHLVVIEFGLSTVSYIKCLIINFIFNTIKLYFFTDWHKPERSLKNTAMASMVFVSTLLITHITALVISLFV